MSCIKKQPDLREKTQHVAAINSYPNDFSAAKVHKIDGMKK
jgi:hypothetical protein